jgi:hypothetical protein
VFDSSGKIGNADECKNHYDLLRRGEPVKGITLHILDGQEETDYWSGIAQIQASLKSVGIDEDVEMEGAHVLFDEDGETIDSSKHVIFEDSEDDASEEETFKADTREKHRKKRHRSLK